MKNFTYELGKTRKEAQLLHKQVCENITKAEATIWAETTTLNNIKIAQADMRALVIRIKALVADQAHAFETRITSTISDMEGAGKDIEMKAIKSFKLTNDDLLDSARKATQSLSHAVAKRRMKVANNKEMKSWITI